MATEQPAAKEAPAGARWAKKYPPLVSLLGALLITLVVLPSSLNLPQSNPSTTLEYAPVPPDDEAPPPNSGNVSSLGLAGSGTLEQGGLPGGDGDGPGLPPPLADQAGQGRSPRTKNCVLGEDGKARQTEDPLAPPCVADFRGDNFGATYQGVTGEEVRILFYVQGNTNYTNTCSNPNQVTPDGEYFDLAETPKEDEHCMLRVLRTWQTYFNDRYQAYNRFVHFFVYFSGAGASPEERKADAVENYNRVKPFAVISTAGTFNESYLDIMANRGVLNFGSFVGQSETFYQRFPKLVWGYLPSLEQQAKVYAGYICRTVAGGKVQAGSPANVGKDRVYGLWSTSDPAHPELQAIAKEVESLIGQCGVKISSKRTFPSSGWVRDTRYSPRYATEAVAEFQGKGITTVIWPGGLETNFTAQAANVGYQPEFILLGDGVIETDTSGTFQDQTVFNGAKVVTPQTLVLDIRKSECYVAFREADPNADDIEIQATACTLYPNIRQLFTGIQVAGPRLGPTSVDKGFHAIPPIRSPRPDVPACFYDPGDYTCVKDAISERWVTGKDDDGCFAVDEGGARYFAEVWPEGNIRDRESDADACNAYDDSFLINPGTPDDPTNF